MILLIDNKDSSIFNLAKIFIKNKFNIKICNNNLKEKYISDNQAIIELICISAGPKSVNNSGNIFNILKKFYKQIPILGICLGHQIISVFFGGRIVNSFSPKHGEIEIIKLKKHSLFNNIPKVIKVVRYNSLIVEKKSLPKCFKVLSCCIKEEEIMIIIHKKYLIVGLQFHPESILTLFGEKIIVNFLKKCIKKE